MPVGKLSLAKTSIGGVNEPCGREEHYNYQTNSYSGFSFIFVMVFIFCSGF